MLNMRLQEQRMIIMFVIITIFTMTSLWRWHLPSWSPLLCVSCAKCYLLTTKTNPLSTYIIYLTHRFYNSQWLPSSPASTITHANAKYSGEWWCKRYLRNNFQLTYFYDARETLVERCIADYPPTLKVELFNDKTKTFIVLYFEL